MAPADPLPVGTRVEVVGEGRLDAGLTGVVTDVSATGEARAVALDNGMGAWYGLDDLRELERG